MMRLAMPASRSLIALLVGTVALFALVFVELKPGGSSSGGGSQSQGLGSYQSAINQAHQAVKISGANDAASGNDAAPAPSSAPAATSAKATSSTATGSASSSAAQSTVEPPTHAVATKAAAKPVTAAARLSTVQHALDAHKVVAMLFFNPAAADDQAVKQELAAVPTHRRQVVKLTIPLSQAANFTAVIQHVPVNFSPTLVLIAPGGQAGEIVGFSDQFEIAQRIDDALAAK
jgi:hypothetical protein